MKTMKIKKEFYDLLLKSIEEHDLTSIQISSCHKELDIEFDGCINSKQQNQLEGFIVEWFFDSAVHPIADISVTKVDNAIQFEITASGETEEIEDWDPEVLVEALTLVAEKSLKRKIEGLSISVSCNVSGDSDRCEVDFFDISLGEITIKLSKEILAALKNSTEETIRSWAHKNLGWKSDDFLGYNLSLGDNLIFNVEESWAKTCLLVAE